MSNTEHPLQINYQDKCSYQLVCEKSSFTMISPKFLQDDKSENKYLFEVFNLSVDMIQMNQTILIDFEVWVSKPFHEQLQYINLIVNQSKDGGHLEEKQYQFTQLQEESCDEEIWTKLSFKGAVEINSNSFSSLLVYQTQNLLFKKITSSPLKFLLIKKMQIKSYNSDYINSEKCKQNLPEIDCEKNNLIYLKSLKKCIDNSVQCLVDEIQDLETSTCIKQCTGSKHKFFSNEISTTICVQGYNTCSNNLLPGCKVCDQKSEVCFICEESYLLQTHHCVISIQNQYQLNNPIQLDNSLKENYRYLQPCNNANSIQRCQTYDSTILNCTQCCPGSYRVSDYCQQCPDGMAWDNSVSVSGGCNFLSTIYSNLSAACLSTSDNGKTCTCFPSFSLDKKGQCNDNCKNNQVKPTGQNNCSQCSSLIKNCTNCNSENICIQCNNSYKLYSYSNANSLSPPNTTCVTSCPSQYFEKAKTCYPCGLKCNSCSSTKCNTCRQGYILSANNWDCQKAAIACPSSCVCQGADNYCASCQPGYFYIQEVCYPCISNCDSCTNGSSCTACATGFNYNQLKNICEIVCLPSTYLDNSTNTCLPCQANCDKCTSPYFCSLCFTGFYYDATYQDCTSVCPIGTIFDGISCVACPSNCETCNPSTTCSQCFSGYTLDGSGNCVSAIANASCSSISGACLACSSSATCTSCIAGQYINGSQSCSTCNTNCAICTSGSSSGCSTCQAGYLNVSGKCQQICPYNQSYSSNSNSCVANKPYCLTQNTSGACILCADTYYVDNSNCSPIPNPFVFGYYLKSGSKSPCINGCMQCSDSDSCNTCFPWFYKQYSFSKNKFICSQCMANCVSCSNFWSCSQCARGYNYNSNSMKCLSICPTGQYWSGASCLSCGQYCNTCTSPTQCTQCQTGYTVVSGLCQQIPTCSSNQYYSWTDNLCHSCSINCLTCTSANNCTQCISQYSVISGICFQTNCNSNQYYDTVTQSCEDCSSYCLYCTSLTTCTACDISQGYYLSSGLCTNISPCSSTQYFQISTTTCINCINNCLSCTSSTVCTSCENANGYYLMNQQCILTSKCGDGNMNLQMNVNGAFLSKQCDDRNTSNGDGCSSTCQLEKGFTCTYSSASNKSICTAMKAKYTFSLKSSLDSNGNPQVEILFPNEIQLFQNFTNTTNYTDQDLLSLLNNSMVIQIEGLTSQDYTFAQVVNQSKDTITLTFTMNTNIKNKHIQVTFNDDSFEIVNSLSTNASSGPFPDYVVISQSQKEQAQTAAAAGNAVTQTIVAFIVPIILFANFSLLFNALDLFQMILYLQYVNIRLPFNVITFINIMTSFQLPFSTNLFQYIINDYPIEEANLPAAYERQGAESVFLLNTGDSITQLLILVVIHLILIIIVQITKNKEKGCFHKTNHYLKHKLHTSWEWGWYLDMYWDMFLSLIVGGLLQFYGLNAVDAMSTVNYVFTIVIFIFAIVSPFIFWSIIFRSTTILEDEKMEHRWGMLYESLAIKNLEQIAPCLPTNVVYPLPAFNLAKGPTQTSIQIGDTSPIGQHLVHQSSQESQKKDSMIATNQRFSELQIQNNQNTNVQIASKKSKLALDYFNFKQVPFMDRLAKYYFIILYLRKLFFGIVIVLMHDFTMAQLIVIDCLNVILIIILARSKPYTSKYENYKSIICEVFMIIAQFSFKFLISDSDSQPETERINIGWVFIICVVGILAVQFIFLFSTVLPILIQLLKKLKQKCFKKSQVAPLKEVNPDENQQDDGEKSVLSYQKNKISLIELPKSNQIIQSEGNENTQMNMIGTPHSHQVNCTERSPVSPTRDHIKSSDQINISEIQNSSKINLQEVSQFDNSNITENNNISNNNLDDNQQQQLTNQDQQNISYATFRAV